MLTLSLPNVYVFWVKVQVFFALALHEFCLGTLQKLQIVNFSAGFQKEYRAYDHCHWNSWLSLPNVYVFWVNMQVFFVLAYWHSTEAGNFEFQCWLSKNKATGLMTISMETIFMVKSWLRKNESQCLDSP